MEVPQPDIHGDITSGVPSRRTRTTSAGYRAGLLAASHHLRRSSSRRWQSTGTTGLTIAGWDKRFRVGATAVVVAVARPPPWGDIPIRDWVIPALGQTYDGSDSQGARQQDEQRG
jgi:hypothetical protein